MLREREQAYFERCCASPVRAHGEYRGPRTRRRQPAGPPGGKERQCSGACARAGGPVERRPRGRADEVTRREPVCRRRSSSKRRRPRAGRRTSLRAAQACYDLNRPSVVPAGPPVLSGIRLRAQSTRGNDQAPSTHRGRGDWQKRHCVGSRPRSAPSAGAKDRPAWRPGGGTTRGAPVRKAAARVSPGTRPPRRDLGETERPRPGAARSRQTMLPGPCHCAAGVDTMGDEIVAARSASAVCRRRAAQRNKCRGTVVRTGAPGRGQRQSTEEPSDGREWSRP